MKNARSRAGDRVVVEGQLRRSGPADAVELVDATLLAPSRVYAALDDLAAAGVVQVGELGVYTATSQRQQRQLTAR